MVLWKYIYYIVDVLPLLEKGEGPRLSTSCASSNSFMNSNTNNSMYTISSIQDLNHANNNTTTTKSYETITASKVSNAHSQQVSVFKIIILQLLNATIADHNLYGNFDRVIYNPLLTVISSEGHSGNLNEIFLQYYVFSDIGTWTES